MSTDELIPSFDVDVIFSLIVRKLHEDRISILIIFAFCATANLIIDWSQCLIITLERLTRQGSDEWTRLCEASLEQFVVLERGDRVVFRFSSWHGSIYLECFDCFLLKRFLHSAVSKAPWPHAGPP